MTAGIAAAFAAFAKGAWLAASVYLTIKATL